MLGAALVPGRPRVSLNPSPLSIEIKCPIFQANMYFTLYAYNSTEQGRSMTRDLKMGEWSWTIGPVILLTEDFKLAGQYTKLPPRVTFTMYV